MLVSYVFRKAYMFTMENYKLISKYRVGYFSFYLPIAAAKVMVKSLKKNYLDEVGKNLNL